MNNSPEWKSYPLWLSILLAFVGLVIYYSFIAFMVISIFVIASHT